MSESQSGQAIKSLQVELTAEIYNALIAKAQSSGCSVSELVQQGLCMRLGLAVNDSHNLGEDLRSLVAQTIEMRLSELESRIMQRVQMQIESRMAGIKTEVANASFAEPLAATPVKVPAQISPPPSVGHIQVRQLQIGDIVQVRDSDSPHYMEQLRIVEVGMIRATVSTEQGNQTFLKRDLRFVSSASDAIA